MPTDSNKKWLTVFKDLRNYLYVWSGSLRFYEIVLSVLSILFGHVLAGFMAQGYIFVFASIAFALLFALIPSVVNMIYYQSVSHGHEKMTAGLVNYLTENKVYFNRLKSHFENKQVGPNTTKKWAGRMITIVNVMGVLIAVFNVWSHVLQWESALPFSSSLWMGSHVSIILFMLFFVSIASGVAKYLRNRSDNGDVTPVSRWLAQYSDQGNAFFFDVLRFLFVECATREVKAWRQSIVDLSRSHTNHYFFSLPKSYADDNLPDDAGLAYLVTDDLPPWWKRRSVRWTCAITMSAIVFCFALIMGFVWWFSLWYAALLGVGIIVLVNGFLFISGFFTPNQEENPERKRYEGLFWVYGPIVLIEGLIMALFTMVLSHFCPLPVGALIAIALGAWCLIGAVSCGIQWLLVKDNTRQVNNWYTSVYDYATIAPSNDPSGPESGVTAGSLPEAHLSDKQKKEKREAGLSYQMEQVCKNKIRPYRTLEQHVVRWGYAAWSFISVLFTVGYSLVFLVYMLSGFALEVDLLHAFTHFPYLCITAFVIALPIALFYACMEDNTYMSDTNLSLALLPLMHDLIEVRTAQALSSPRDSSRLDPLLDESIEDDTLPPLDGDSSLDL